ncbi:uncharacterized protein N7459_008572 [Penicillium hispanicum]|uniref:uncharacterized protein n=1 Tax=Penicillium hispanicum TaxID=1080232 RepID=UPI0025409A78|nr:uncharacterized protein N7459_008572 [Penicillium hispanicum]KAJ5574145.1 hypothetical protein N7459_008572 [Penicillium hispanicum]
MEPVRKQSKRAQHSAKNVKTQKPAENRRQARVKHVGDKPGRRGIRKTRPPNQPLRRNPVRGQKATESPQPPPAAWLARGLDQAQDPANPDRSLWQIPTPPASLGSRVWPSIWYGDDAPQPRWRVVPDDTDPETGRDLAPDLIKTRIAETIISGVFPNGHPRSYDSSLGLGGLVWAFDSGPETGWNGLNEEQLYEYAFRCLEEVLKDPTCREQFRIAIRRGNYLEAISNVEDPLPPLPATPDTNHFGQASGLENIKGDGTKIGEVTYYFPRSYKRPFMTITEAYRKAVPKTYQKEADKEVPGETRSNEHAASPHKSDESGLSTASSGAGKSPLSQEYDPEKAVEGASTEPAPASTGESIAPIGECRLVWFGVTILVFSMFLCLFLFSFNIVK